MANKGKKNSKKQKKAKKAHTFFLSLSVILFVLILISTVFNDWVKIIDNKRQTKELSEYYERLLEEQASLNSEVIKLQDPEYIARYAREKYMYTKDGETILKIIDGNVVSEEDESDE